MGLKLITLLFCFLSGLVAFGQISFYKLFTNNGYDFGQGVVQLEDSSYLITGSSSSFLEAPSQAFIMKIDSMGNFLWSKDYGGDESDWGRRIFRKNNYGLVVAGYSNSGPSLNYDFYYFKTDDSGISEWQKYVGTDGWDKLNDAALTRDTGLLMVGETTNTFNENSDAYIVRTNSSGDTLWTRQWGTDAEERINAIAQLNDSVFILAGEMYHPDSLKVKGYFQCLKDDGTIIWESFVGNNGVHGVNGLCITGSSISYVGWAWNEVDQSYNESLGKIFTSGLFDYEYTVTQTDNFIDDHIISLQSPDRLYVAYRYRTVGGFETGYDVSLARYNVGMYWDAAGAYANVANQMEDVAGQLIPTSDGGAIMVGYNSYLGAGGGNVYVLKVGPNDDFPMTDGDPVVNPIVFISEIATIEGLTVYPNPSNGMVCVDWANQSIDRIEVLDAFGREILSLEESVSAINISDLINGIYYLIIDNNSARAVVRIVLVK